LQVVKFCIDGLRCLMPLLELTILLRGLPRTLCTDGDVQAALPPERAV
jgi:hypothetical protein